LEPPPYWTDRPFQSSGRLIWKLMLGALGSIGLMWPRTLQKDGVAGVMRAAGVGPRSATAKGTAATIAALSIAAVPLGMAWAGYPTTPTMPTTHVAIAHRDAAMPEVGLPFGAV
jgi:hypothetical protein